MYEVQMRYMNVEHNSDPFNFSCEKFKIENNNYTFENVFINDFILSDIEISKEDIALIKIN